MLARKARTAALALVIFIRAASVVGVASGASYMLPELSMKRRNEIPSLAPALGSKPSTGSFV